ncbi:PIN domain-containing protein [Streptomyces sp. NBC_00988]|uniref:PIN domain-containing protein n=1 Tax=Streptomyces sp. NBC_00988 TaxID=2903704 RepID=UPI00386CE276|nr:PIN domain-containing protein [Streptomyces sp. NBC_00988]
MTVAGYLIDTSALARVLLRQNTAEWDDRIAADLVAICDLTEPEVLYSARSATDRADLKSALDAHHAWCPMPDGVYRRSHITQEQLTAKGEHRSAGPVDLLMAAAAEEAELTLLLHDDRDFETIARTTGQSVRKIDLRQ